MTKGHADLFAVFFEDGEAHGRRRFLFRAEQGDIILGLPEPGSGAGDGGPGSVLGVLVVGALNTEAMTIANQGSFLLSAADVRGKVDRWISSISDVLVENETTWPEKVAVPDTQINLAVGERLYGRSRRPVWVCRESGNVAFIDDSTSFPVASEDSDIAALPLMGTTWIEAKSDATVSYVDTETLIATNRLLPALKAFHAGVMIRLTDVLERRDRDLSRSSVQRAAASQRAAENGFETLARTVVAEGEEIEPDGGGDPLLTVCRTVGNVLGLDVRSPGRAGRLDPAVETLQQIVAASRLRMRKVMLRDDW